MPGDHESGSCSGSWSRAGEVTETDRGEGLAAGHAVENWDSLNRVLRKCRRILNDRVVRDDDPRYGRGGGGARDGRILEAELETSTSSCERLAGARSVCVRGVRRAGQPPVRDQRDRQIDRRRIDVRHVDVRREAAAAGAGDAPDKKITSSADAAGFIAGWKISCR